MKNKRWIFLTTILIPGLFSGCQRDIPKPKTTLKVMTMQQASLKKESTVPVFNHIKKDLPSIFVRHKLRGNDLFVECIVSGISFREHPQSNQKVGKMIIWIDGKKKQEATAAAFIIKGLPEGNHRIKLEVVNLKNEPYGLTNEFLVNIPKI